MSNDEQWRLLPYLPLHAAQIVQFTLLTGLRAGKVFNLTWDKVDLKQRIIQLEPEDTKNSEPRVIYLNDELLGIMREAGKVRGFGHKRVFTYKG